MPLNEQARTLTLVFTDLVDSTAFKSSSGDQAFGEVVNRHRETVGNLAAEFRGRVVLWAGDGCFLTFEASSAAVLFALRLQRNHLNDASLPALRIGIHIGEVTESIDSSTNLPRVDGLAVDLASRIQSLALPGQVLISAAVFNSVRQRLRGEELGTSISWLAHGPYQLKGFDDPLEICEAGFEGISPLSPPDSSEKAHRAVSPAEEDTLGWRPAVGLSVPRRENWVLEQKLGEGGFGEVWLSIHEKTKAKRVFKFCFEIERVRGLKREVILFRLLKESLGHRDDIAQILDWGFDNAPYFLESEYTEGGDLVEWTKTKGGLDKVPFEVRLELVAQAAVALGAAHSVGVLHKDIKPSNILISEVGGKDKPRVCLTDFGIGLLTDRAALLARGITAVGLTETLVRPGSSSSTGTGTRLYMAPEILEGKPATTLSDIYSLGIVLYQMAICDFTHALASGWERDIEDDLLREDISACVEGSPERRLKSADELAERLRSLPNRRGERDRQQRLVFEAERAQRHRRQFILASTFGVILTLLVGAFAVWEHRRAEGQANLRSEAEQARKDAESERERADEFRKKAEHREYLAILRATEARLQQRNIGLARDLLHSVPEDRRGWEWGCLADRLWPDIARDDTGPPRPIEPGMSHALMWDQASTSLKSSAEDSGATLKIVPSSVIVSRGQNRIQVWDYELKNRLLEFEISDPSFYPYDVSSDGKLIAAPSSTPVVTMWSAETGQIVRTFQGHNSSVPLVIFSPDARYLLTASWDGAAKLWEVETGRELFSILLEQAPGGAIPSSFRSDSSAVILRAGLHELKIYSVPQGEAIGEVAPKEPNGDAIDISRDWTLVLSIDVKNTVSVWDFRTGKTIARFTLSGSGRFSTWNPPRFSPDGSCVVAQPDETTIEFWDSKTGRQLTEIRSNSGFEKVHFFPDGSILCKEFGQNRLIHLAPGLNPPTYGNTLVGHTHLVPQVRFSRDGRKILTPSYDGSAILWDAATRKPLATLKGHTAQVVSAQFNPDQTKILTLAWDGTSRIWDASTGQPLQTIQSGNLPPSVLGGPLSKDVLWNLGKESHNRFSPNGKRVVVPLSGGAGAIADVETGAIVSELRHRPDEWTHDGEFSPDGAFVLTYPWPEKNACLWNAATGGLVREIPRETLSARFTADGAAIVVAGGGVAMYDTLTGEVRWKTREDLGPVDSMALSRDGRRVIAGMRQGEIHILDTETGETLKVIRDHSDSVNGVTTSPDGSFLISHSGDKSTRIWDWEGNNVLNLGENRDCLDAVWRPDGRSIVTTRMATDKRELNEIEIFESIPWKELEQYGNDSSDIGWRISEWRRARKERVGD